MEKYIITSKKKEVESKMLLSYNDTGILVSVQFEDCTIKQVSWLMDRVPVIVQLLKNRCDVNNLKLDKVIEDLSFDSFWNKFEYKVGKKMRAKRLWEAMSDMEKMAAMANIPRYLRFIKIMNQNSAYPETWLNNKMWENEYVVK